MPDSAASYTPTEIDTIASSHCTSAAVDQWRHGVYQLPGTAAHVDDITPMDSVSVCGVSNTHSAHKPLVPPTAPRSHAVRSHAPSMHSTIPGVVRGNKHASERYVRVGATEVGEKTGSRVLERERIIPTGGPISAASGRRPIIPKTTNSVHSEKSAPSVHAKASRLGSTFVTSRPGSSMRTPAPGRVSVNVRQQLSGPQSCGGKRTPSSNTTMPTLSVGSSAIPPTVSLSDDTIDRLVTRMNRLPANVQSDRTKVPEVFGPTVKGYPVRRIENNVPYGHNRNHERVRAHAFNVLGQRVWVESREGRMVIVRNKQ